MMITLLRSSFTPEELTHFASYSYRLVYSRNTPPPAMSRSPPQSQNDMTAKIDCCIETFISAEFVRCHAVVS